MVKPPVVKEKPNRGSVVPILGKSRFEARLKPVGYVALFKGRVPLAQSGKSDRVFVLGHR
jgi:hypothetical protein